MLEAAAFLHSGNLLHVKIGNIQSLFERKVHINEEICSKSLQIMMAVNAHERQQQQENCRYYVMNGITGHTGTD